MADGGGGGGAITLRLSLKGAEQVRAALEQLGPAGQRAMRELERSMRQPTAGLRALDAATSGVASSLDSLGGRVGPIGTAMQQLGPWGFAAAAGLGAVAAGLAALLRFGPEYARWAADLTDSADRIGIGVEALQRWRYVADEAGVATDTMASNLERLNGMVGAFKAGIGDGRLKPIFEELGITKAQLDQIETADQLMMLLADTLGQVEDRAIQVRLAKGLGVEESLPILRLGAERIRALAEEADQLAVVVDERTVAALDRADRQMELAGQRMQALVTIGIAPLVSGLGEAAEGAADFIVQWSRIAEEAPGWIQALLNLVDAMNVLNPIAAARGYQALVRRIFGGDEPAAGGDPETPRSRRPGGFELQGHGSGGAGKNTARQAEQRRRALEDIELTLSLEEARLTNDRDRVRELERQRELTQMIRRLEDLGLSTDEARRRATEAQTRLDAARQRSLERQRQEIEAQTYLEIARAEEAWGVVRSLEREEEIRRRTLAYQQAGLTLAEATAAAIADQLQLDDARSRAMQRWLENEAAALEIETARLRGDHGRVRVLERELWIRERSEALQREGGLSPRDADRQAADEAAALERARVYGIFRDGVRGALEGLRRGELADWFMGLADRFASRLEDRLADQLTPLFARLAEMLLGGKGGFGGWVGSVLGDVFGAGGPSGSKGPASGSKGPASGGFFGPRAAWGGAQGGGRILVGERGPEIVSLPPGAIVHDHEASLRMLRAERAGAERDGVGALAFNGPLFERLVVNNHGAEKLDVRSRRLPDGGVALDLYPAARKAIEQAGRDGTLRKALGASPQPRRR